jgi:hypothetical protein
MDDGTTSQISPVIHVGPPRSPFNHAGRFTPAWTSPTRSPTRSPGTIWIPPLATASLASCRSKVDGVALPLPLAVLASHCDDDSRALPFSSGGGADGQKDYLGTRRYNLYTGFFRNNYTKMILTVRLLACLPNVSVGCTEPAPPNHLAHLLQQIHMSSC